ncbi:hypothetical protein KBC79_03930 [Candidatus Woesebacteria bacterium]|nr:hypothetical protein [Candidatus Woesebacteria bacterium]
MATRRLIVTHHAPDLDAIGGVWILKKFDAQHFGTAKVAFTDPGSKLSDEQLAEYGVTQESATYVDTGGGEFDHHQPGMNDRSVCATTLVYDHICEIHPEFKDSKPLKAVVDFITDIDHFGEVYWPEAANTRYFFMIHELIRGLEFQELHNDESQLHFGMQCLDSAYAVHNEYYTAQEILSERAHTFELPFGNCIGIETHNDDTIKVAQRQGTMLVVRKDPTVGIIRIKVRPDCPIDLRELADRIALIDTEGSWFYHPSGKMLLNGSSKSSKQKPSPLTLQEVISLIKEIYGNQEAA